MITLTLLIEGSSSLTLSVSTGVTQADLALKVDKVEGKELSTNDYDNTEKAKVAASIDNSTDTYTSEAKVMHVVSLTQNEYDAIETPDENTLYYIPTA